VNRLGASPAGTGPAGPPRAGVALRRLLEPADRLFDRVYGSRWNPLYQSGALALLFLGVTVVTGVYLFLFYRIAEAHESVRAIQESVFLGAWVRSLHRYSADLALVATGVHVLRKLAQGHTWGPRALAWLTGILAVGAVLASGWTGLVLVWDAQALQIAVEGARLFDLLPVFAEPISRMFSGVQPVPSSFFFMNLFLHVALPLGVAAVVAVHVSRVARPVLVPPRAMARFTLLVLALFAAAWPVALAPEADLRVLPGEVATDLFFAPWLPLARRIPAAAHAALWVAGAAGLGALSRLWRPRRAIAVSSVDEDRCSGCTTCYQDCPYEAIAMVRRERPSKQTSEYVARVDPRLCVGCGICAASCAPMGVGPEGRTGRDQLVAVRAFADALPAAAASGPEVAILACRNHAEMAASLLERPGRRFVETHCSGSVHTAAVEQLLRRGFGGVLLLTCPPRNCSYREGPKWLEARLHDGREAALPARVDRRRVATAAFALAELGTVEARLAELERTAAELRPPRESGAEPEPECDREAAERVLAEVANG
jgi:ferredoxin